MYKIAAIGDSDSVSAFASIGVEVFTESRQKEATKLLKTLADDDYGVIFVTEEVAELIGAEIAKLSERVVPAIIPIPGVRGNTGLGMKNLSAFVEQAVGSDILA